MSCVNSSVLVERIKASSLVYTHVQVNRLSEVELTLQPHDLNKVLARLKDHKDFLFQQLIDLCGVDYPQRKKRFDVVYHLLSLHYNQRLRLKVSVELHGKSYVATAKYRKAKPLLLADSLERKYPPAQYDRSLLSQSMHSDNSRPHWRKSP